MSSSLGNGNMTFGDGTVQSTAYVGALGVGQTWQNVTGSRAFSTTYYNTTGKPIYAAVSSIGGSVDTYNGIQMMVNGVQFNGGTSTGRGSATASAVFSIIPSSASYSVTSSYGLTNWSELR